MNANYPQPTVVEAPSGTLNPNDAVNGATVRVSYAMLDTDLILLSWDGRSDLVVPKPGNPSGAVDFLVPREAVVDASGKTIEVIYTVIRAGAAEPSTALDLTVEFYYPEPVVVEAPSGTLDPNDAVNGATVRVSYAMLDTDLILLSWDGRSDLVAPKPGNPSGAVDFLVPREAVVDASGKTIEVIYTVIRSGATQPSMALNLTVEAVDTEIQPIILKVTGASGDVPDGGETPDNMLTISGIAGSGVTLDVSDGAYPVETIMSESDGSWTLTLSGLTETEHRITAKNSGGQLVSQAWSFTVNAMEAPTIAHVRDSKGEVEPEGTTLDTVVTLEGRAAAGQRVEILDDGELKDEVTVDGNGDWTYILQGLTVKGYIITARGQYANNPVSQRRTFSVVTLGREDFEGYQGPVELPTGVNISFANGLVCLITGISGSDQATIMSRIPNRPHWGLKRFVVWSGHDPRFEFGRLIRTFKFTYENYATDSVTFYAADDTEIQSHTIIKSTLNTVELTLSRPCAYCKFRINLKDVSGERSLCALDNLEWS